MTGKGEAAAGRVSLVGAGPGDPELWTVRAVRRIQDADIVFYDALIDVDALRRLTRASCFCVGKRAGRASVSQETIHRLMIRAAREGKRVVRLKGGDPFVFGRGAEEALALARAGIPCEVVPGVTTAVAAPELAGIPVTHRGLSSGFLVLAGHGGEALDQTLRAVRANSLTVVVMMALSRRGEMAARLMEHGWAADTPAAIVCAASTPEAWTWVGRLDEVSAVAPPAGLPGVLVFGEVVQVHAAMRSASVTADAGTRVSASGESSTVDEVKYGRS